MRQKLYEIPIGEIQLRQGIAKKVAAFRHYMDEAESLLEMGVISDKILEKTEAAIINSYKNGNIGLPEVFLEEYKQFYRRLVKLNETYVPYTLGDLICFFANGDKKTARLRLVT